MKRKNVRFLVTSVIPESTLLYGDRQVGTHDWLKVRLNVWINIRNNVYNNVREHVWNKVEDTKPTTDQLNKALDLLK